MRTPVACVSACCSAAMTAMRLSRPAISTCFAVVTFSSAATASASASRARAFASDSSRLTTWRGRLARVGVSPNRRSLLVSLRSRAERTPPARSHHGRGFMIRKARAVWQGTGKDGTGHISTDSGILSKTPYSFKTRFESEPGTNPEELIAAAHAGCFTMALAFQLQAAGFTPEELSTEAAVSLDQDGTGFKISKSALTLTAKVPGLTQEKFDEL